MYQNVFAGSSIHTTSRTLCVGEFSGPLIAQSRRPDVQDMEENCPQILIADNSHLPESLEHFDLLG
jgi:hypothetical protein